MENVTQPWKTMFQEYWLSGTYSNLKFMEVESKMESLANGKIGE